MKPPALSALFLRVICCIVALLCIGAHPLAAQGMQFPDSLHVTLVSEPDGAEVYDDGKLLGHTPLRVETAHAPQIEIYYPARAAFKRERRTLNHPVNAMQGVVIIVFTTWLRIETSPFGAEVRLNDSLLGTTPLLVSLASGGGTLRVSKAGYRTESLPVSLTVGRALLLTLTPDDSRAQQTQSVIFYHHAASEIGLNVLLPAGLGLASTVAAISWKQRANGYYNDYLNGYDPAAFDRAYHYDILSGCALIVTQLAAGYFFYLLFR
jgi:hypothetical protein